MWYKIKLHKDILLQYLISIKRKPEEVFSPG